MTLRAQGLLAAAFAAALAAAALDVWVAYAISPAAAVALPLAVAAGIVILRDPLVGVCLGVLAVPLEAFGFSAGAAGFSPAELALIATAGSAALRIALDGVGRPLDPVHLTFASLVALVALGYLVAEDNLIVTKILAMWTAFLVVSIYVASLDRDRLEVVLTCIALAGGVVGLLAVGGTGDQSLQANGAIATGRAQASFEQPNLLGFFLALTIPVAIVMSARGSALKASVMLGCATAATIGLTLSLSRTSIIGTLLALAILLVWPPFRRVAAVGIAGLSLFALLNLDALERSTQLQLVGDRLGTLRDQGVARDDLRWEMWTKTPELVSDHFLLGVGQGNYAVASEGYGILDPDGLPFDHAHNVPLTIAAESGILGLTAFVAFLFFVALAARRALRNRDDPAWPLALALVAALAATVVTGLGDYPPRANVIMAVMMIEVGALVACARIIAPRRGPEPTPDPPSAPR